MLEGKRCPNALICPFEVVVYASFLLYDEAATRLRTAQSSTMTDAPARCYECRYQGKLGTSMPYERG